MEAHTKHSQPACGKEAKRNNKMTNYFAGFPNILLPCVQEDSGDWAEDTAGGT